MNLIIERDMHEIAADAIVDYSKLFGKTVMITGAYGMIASYLIYLLIHLNETVAGSSIQIVAQGRNQSKLTARFSEYLQKPYFSTIICDVSALPDRLPRADYIIHAASLASPNYYGKCPVDVALPNTLGTNLLLKKAVVDQTEGFLFVSSGAAQGYFDNSNGIVTEATMGYIDPLNLHSCYDESKRFGETLCSSYAFQYGVPAKIVRPSHTYGPTMNLEDSRSFACFVADVVAGRNIIMKSDGSAIRMYCYLSDAVKAYYKVLLDAPSGEAFSVVESDYRIRIRDLCELLVRISGNPNIKVVRESRSSSDSYYESAQADNVPYYSSDKLKALGWKANVGIEEGFRRTLESFGVV
jgi:nucleoside-diphosphate-sugar epimerase